MKGIDVTRYTGENGKHVLFGRSYEEDIYVGTTLDHLFIVPVRFTSPHDIDFLKPILIYKTEVTIQHVLLDVGKDLDHLPSGWYGYLTVSEGPFVHMHKPFFLGDEEFYENCIKKYTKETFY